MKNITKICSTILMIGSTFQVSANQYLSDEENYLSIEIDLFPKPYKPTPFQAYQN